jgi:hypothetical protein
MPLFSIYFIVLLVIVYLLDQMFENALCPNYHLPFTLKWIRLQGAHFPQEFQIVIKNN